MRPLRRAVQLVARRLLPLARSIWRRLPAGVRERLGPPLLRVRFALGLGAKARRLRFDRSALPDVVPAGPPRQSLPVARRSSGPSVSVIVPTHDDEAFLETCLRSIVEQGHEDLECIVIDDRSVDGSLDVALSVASSDPRVRIARHEVNAGLAASRNTGLRLAQGRYVCFLDADDFLFQDSIARRVESAEAASGGTVGSWCDWMIVPEDAGLRTEPGPVERHGVVEYGKNQGENQLISTSPLLRLDIVRSLGGFDERFRTAEDFEFWTRLLRNGFRLEEAGMVGVAYRQKRVSMVSADPAAHARNAMHVYRYMERELDDAEVSPLATDPVRHPLPGIPSPVRRAERLVTFLTYAWLSEDPDQVDALLEMVAHEPVIGSIDVRAAAKRALARHSVRVGGIHPDRRSEIEREIADRVEATPGPMPDRHADGLVHAADPSRVTGGTVTSSVVVRRSMPDWRPWDVVLAGSSRFGVRSLLDFGGSLVGRGCSVAALEPGLGGETRRRAHFEGIRLVAHPTGATRLAVTDGASVESTRADVVVALGCSPWLDPGRTPMVRPDVAYVRADWEGELWSSTGAEIRPMSGADGEDLAAGAPVDGQALRRRSSTILVLRSPEDTEGPGRDPIVTAIGDDFELAFGRRLRAPVRVECSPTRVDVVLPFVRAVVVVGRQVPTAALLAGTPVVLLGSPAPDLPGVEAADLATLGRVLDRSTPRPVRPTPALAGAPVVEELVSLLGSR
ncbi:MAG: glycosyltransferase family A protein [Actinomycetota bacterium]